jgi:hypothetical protein
MARNGNSGGGFYFPFGVIWIVIWLIYRGASGGRSSSGAAEHRVDVQAIARSSDRRRTVARSRQNNIPVPAPSPRSHPMWDRDLDGI